MEGSCIQSVSQAIGLPAGKHRFTEFERYQDNGLYNANETLSLHRMGVIQSYYIFR